MTCLEITLTVLVVLTLSANILLALFVGYAMRKNFEEREVAVSMNSCDIVRRLASACNCTSGLSLVLAVD